MGTARARLASASIGAAILLGACGSDDDPGAQRALPPPPPLTVPGYSGTPRIPKKETEAPGADTAAAAEARASETQPDAVDPPDAQGASQSAPPPPASPATNTNVPRAGSDAATPEEFQAFCANNPGAC